MGLSRNYFLVIVIWLLQVYLSEEIRIRLRYYRSYRSYYYYYYSYGYSYYDDSLSTAAIVGIVIGSIGGLILFVVGCVICCVCCCACCKSSSNNGQVINSPSQTQTVATISTSQLTSVGSPGYSSPNPQDQSLQQQQDGYKYFAPPPAYGQAVNQGFQNN